MNEYFDFNKKNGFHPHVTVAYGDLTPENFDRTWKEYRNKTVSEKFTVSSTGIYKKLITAGT